MSGNPTEIQIKIDEAELLEWNTILAKRAARLVSGPEAEGVRKHHSHRIMGYSETRRRLGAVHESTLAPSGPLGSRPQ